MTTTTADLLLQAILDDPADDAVRLVLADVLEEQGDTARAEFIRVQVELARYYFRRPNGVKHYHNAPDMQARLKWVLYLETRERELWAAGGDLDDSGWFVGLEGYVISPDTSPDDMTAVVRRGFVSSITLSLADLERHAEALWGRQPIEGVTLTDKRPFLFPGDTKRHEFSMWQWYPHEPIDTLPYRIPAFLVPHLKAAGGFSGQSKAGPGEGRRENLYYRTEADALAALSRAAVLWGRTKGKRRDA